MTHSIIEEEFLVMKSIFFKVFLALFMSAALVAPVIAEPENPVVRIETNMGIIKLELNSQKAPATVRNFLSYVDEGLYNNTLFHRVIKNFMIQGGGFERDMTRRPPKGPVKNEADNGLKNFRGTIAMARTSDPHSATSQFFINHKNNASLDHRGKSSRTWGYCVFGKVIDGMAIVDKIANSPTTTKGPYRNVPVSPVVIKKVVRENR